MAGFSRVWMGLSLAADMASHIESTSTGRARARVLSYSASLRLMCMPTKASTKISWLSQKVVGHRLGPPGLNAFAPLRDVHPQELVRRLRH